MQLQLKISGNLFILIWQSLLPHHGTCQENVKNQNSNLMVELHCLANFFRKMVKTKGDLHKILDNFHLKRFLTEEMICYVNSTLSQKRK